MMLNNSKFHFAGLTHKDIEERQKQYLAKNRVIVHVWTSENNIRNQGAGVGHVSIEVGDTYMSLWPKQRRRKEFDVVPPDFVLNYEIEKSAKYEGRESEYTFCFYTLDKQDILSKFEKLRTELHGWCLYGGICKNAESCVSFAWQLLEAGGIKNLVSPIASEIGALKESSTGSFFSSKASSSSNSEQASHGSKYAIEQILAPVVISPDALVNRLQLAKEAEIKKLPLTQEIKYEGEATQNYDQKIIPGGIFTLGK